MMRIAIAGVMIVIAIIIFLVAFMLDKGLQVSDLLLNLGTEVVGIAMVVAIVDWLIERSKLAEEAQRIAWNILHDLDHAVWVWQGGRREFHLDELAALLELVKENDVITPSTRVLLANLGVRASDMLRLQGKVFRIHKQLRHGLVCLSDLAQIRELGAVMNARAVCESLRVAIHDLSSATGQPIHTGEFGVVQKFRDASAEAQEKRYHGAQEDSMAGQVIWPAESTGAVPGSAPRPKG